MRFLNLAAGAALTLSFFSHGGFAQVVTDCTGEDARVCCVAGGSVGQCSGAGDCDVAFPCDYCEGWAYTNTCEDPTPVYLGDGVFCGGPFPCSSSGCCTAESDDDTGPGSADDDSGDDDVVFGDPHMKGLSGQQIDWSGVNGAWYSLIKDDNAALHVNLRVTAPLPEEFPDRQLVTGISILSESASLTIEVKDPYTTVTEGCPEGISPCLANGGLRATVDGREAEDLLRFLRQEPVAGGIMKISASNLPAECRKFGGDKIWALTYEEMMQSGRALEMDQSFEEWILSFHHVAAPEWCAKYIAENDLSDLQSTYSIFMIEAPSATVRLNVGVNYQGGGQVNWDGRVLPDLEFWQMDVGFDGLDIENPALSGILGETARPVYDENGRAVMEGFEAFRGTVEDYRVSDALGEYFSLLGKGEAGHE